jgi:hypothetical protein
VLSIAGSVLSYVSRFESYPVPTGHSSVAYLMMLENITSDNGIADVERMWFEILFQLFPGRT